MQNTVQNYPESESIELFQLRLKNGERITGEQHETGSKAVGVFVHGYRSTRAGSKSKAFMANAIQQGYSWKTVDLRGHGESDGLFEEFTLKNALEDLLEVLDSVKQRKILLVGSSMGGWLSLLAAQRRSSQVKAIMLIAPAINFVQNLFGSLSEQELDTWAKSGSRNFTDLYSSSVYTLNHKIMDEHSSPALQPSNWPIHCPIKIIHGDQDEVVPLARSRHFVDQYNFDNIELQVVKGGDHRLNQYILQMCGHINTLWQQMARDQ